MKRSVVLVALVIVLALVALFVSGVFSPQEEPLAPVAPGEEGDEGSVTPVLEGTGAAQSAVDIETADANAEPGFDALAGPRIEGRVHDEAGEAVPHAEVRVYFLRGTLREPLTTVRGGEDGSWATTLPGPGDRTEAVRRTSHPQIVAQAPGYRPTRETSTARCTDEGPIRLDTELRKGAVLTGRVVLPDGTPQEDVDLLLYELENEREAAYGETAEDGQFTIGYGVAGTLHLFATCEVGGLAVSDAIRVKEPVDRALPDLVLRAEHTIEGMVQFADGTPVPHVSVWGQELDGSAMLLGPRGEEIAEHVAPHCVSGEDGHFRMVVYAPGRYELSPALLLANADVICRAGDADVRIVIPSHALRLRVVDETGAPLPGATWTLLIWEEGREEHVERMLQGASSAEDALRSADASSVGRLQAPDGRASFFVPPGCSCLLGASVEGMAPAETVVQAAKERHETEVELRIGVARPTGRLALTVLDALGQRVREVRVTLNTMAGWHALEAQADDDGVLPPLPAGRWRMEVFAGPGGDRFARLFHLDSPYFPAASVVEIPAGGELAEEVRVETGGWLALTVALPEGDDAEELEPRAATYRAAHEGEESVRIGRFVSRDDAGSLSMMSWITPARRLRVGRLLPPGDYVLSLDIDGYLPVEQPFRVTPGEETHLAVRLLPR